MNQTRRVRNFSIALLFILLLFFLVSDTQGNLALSQSTIFNFITQAGSASWRSAGGGLPYPGKDTDQSGFVMPRQGAKMEDGGTYGLVLQTHPNWEDNGWILGTYTHISIPAGSEVFVKAGFLNGAPESDGVTYFVKVTAPGAKPVTVLTLGKTYTGKLSQMSASLADFAGKTVDIELRVNAGPSSGKDWAAWVEAKIIQSVAVQVSDTDRDGIPDASDNCPSVANPQQENQDGDAQGDACDACDDRDNDKDGIVNCQDDCPELPETLNGYQDQDGCPDSAPAIDNTLPDRPIPPSFAEPNLGWFAGILDGPLMPGAFEDGDQDGVMNFQDDCPNTPLDSGIRVFENGCFCSDSDGGTSRSALMEAGYLHYRIAGGESGFSDSCQDEDTLIEFSCNPLAETSLLPENAMYIRSTINCSTLGFTPFGSDWACVNNRCQLQDEGLPRFCFSSGGTCADGIQNQDEDGIDCGGLCPPCSTTCTTGTRYAPLGSPCTSIFPDDPHEIELYWTSTWLEHPCQLYEVCHPDLDHVIAEAAQCCSIPNTHAGMTRAASAVLEEDAINAMPDPNLCRAARELSSTMSGCSRCVGLYIIKGMGEYARWMQGYTWLYPEHAVNGVEAIPAESLINDYRTGVCRDYAEATATLLRKAGYPQHSVNNFCDGHHCYVLVRLPGDRYWHVVDTTGNAVGIQMGALPGGYPYCSKLDATRYCFDGIRPDGTACDGTELYNANIPPLCQPGVACSRDLFSTPGWGPPLNEIIGCR
jgi:hypothetical protein